LHLAALETGILPIKLHLHWFPGQDSNLDFQSQILAACQLADPGNGGEGWNQTTDTPGFNQLLYP
jgi:hypothetical protein